MISKDEMKSHTWDGSPKSSAAQGDAFTENGRTDAEQARNVPASCKTPSQTAPLKGQEDSAPSPHPEWHDYADDLEDDDGDDGDGWLDQECRLGDDGQCGLAGSEHCDFECPYRDSEFFAGSDAWRKKHAR